MTSGCPPIVGLLFIANTINIGADLSAMGDALKLLVGGPTTVYAILFGALCALAIVFMDYSRYVMLLKWLTLVLFAYVAALLIIHVPWKEALFGLLVPHITWNAAFLTTLVAILCTTISPYLFFWQASQEAEDERIDSRAKPLMHAPEQAPQAFQRIRADTLVGMAFSNFIALAIIFNTAATLNKAGITDVETSVQAAQALKPVAGNLAFVIPL